IRVFLRPTLSPRWPKKTAPKGLAIMAAPKMAKDASRAAVSLPGGKNRCGNTSTAAVAETEKSEKSKEVPTRMANSTREREVAGVDAAVDCMGGLVMGLSG